MVDRDLQPLKGVLLVAVALFLLACVDASTKFLGRSLAVPVLLGGRYVVTALLLVTVLAPRDGMLMVRTRRTGMVVTRSLCMVVSSLMFASALRHIGLAEATAILFIGPILVMGAGRLFLSERIGALGWTAGVLGFLGVLLIARPGGSVDPLGAVLVGMTSLLFAGYHFLSRSLAATETTVAMLFSSNLMGAIVYGAAAAWFWPETGVSTLELSLMVFSGVLSGVGHFMLTSAYRYAPASYLAPVTYVQLLWTGLLGIAVFGDIPDAPSLLGMLVIVAAGVMTALRPRG